MTPEPRDGGGESRPALCVSQPCSPRCTFEGREGQMWMVGMWHSAPGKTGQREGVKLADLNRPGRILFQPFSLYSRLLNIQGSLLVIVQISNDPKGPTAEGQYQIRVLPGNGDFIRWVCMKTNWAIGGMPLKEILRLWLLAVPLLPGHQKAHILIDTLTLIHCITTDPKHLKS